MAQFLLGGECGTELWNNSTQTYRLFKHSNIFEYSVAGHILHACSARRTFCDRGRARLILGIMTAPCTVRAREGLIPFPKLIFWEHVFQKHLKQIRKMLPKRTKLPKTPKLNEISQKMAVVNDFTTKIDFVERKSGIFPILGVGSTCSHPPVTGTRL